MPRRQTVNRALSLAGLFALATFAAGCHWKNAEERAAEPILEKNAEARGGLAAWRAVKTMSMTGKLDAGKAKDPIKLAQSYLRQRREVKADARKALAAGAELDSDKQVQLPFVMELKRPDLSRFEIVFRGDTAVQVFDGSKGWKLRPFLGRREVEPYSEEELRLARQQTEMDGPLLDADRKGYRVELVGSEEVEGRGAYKLKVTVRKGLVRHVWVDKQTFLEVRVDGSRWLDGKERPMWTYFRDYKPVNGLLIPHLLETTVDRVKGSEKIIVEQVAVNPGLDEARFKKPG